MKFGRAHRVVTTALAVFGVLALAGSVRLPGLAPLQILAELLIGAQLVALVTRRGASNDGAIFALALVHLLAGSALGGGLAFLAAFVGLALVLPAALVLSHLRREVEANYQQGARDRSGMPVDVPRILRSRRVMGRGTLAALVTVSLPLLAVTVLLFLAMPRLGAGPRATWPIGLTLDARPGLVRFTDRVDLGQRGELHTNPEVALRFRPRELHAPPPARLPLRFRGAELDTFDGRVWARSARPGAEPRSAPRATVAPPGTRAIAIERESFDPPVLFAPSGTVAVTMKDDRHYVAYVTAEAEAEDRARRAETRGAEASTDALTKDDARHGSSVTEALAPADRARHLALPASPALSARVAALAHAWADPMATPAAKARAIEGHLEKDFAYSLSSSSRGVDQPIDHFLFESRRGHCELFATTMAMMLREVGIPSRSVVGFVGGTYNRFGDYYVVRQGDAHQWVEAWVDGGWRTFDPTPKAPLADAAETGVLATSRELGDAVARRWGSDVVEYDRRTQASIIGVLRTPAGIAAALLVALLVARGLRRGAGEGAASRASRALQRLRGGTTANEADTHAATRLYESLEAALGAHGIVRDRALPPLAHAERLASEQHPLAGDVIALTRVYLDARFGGRPLSGDARRDFERTVSRVAAWQRA